MSDRAERFHAANATAMFVVHDEPGRVRRQLLAGIDSPFPVLVDRDRTAYGAWGLGRAPWWRIWLDPTVWRTYVTLLRSGDRLRGGGEDVLQFGGDFIVDQDGVIVYSRPQQRDDRPPVGGLLATIRDLTD